MIDRVSREICVGCKACGDICPKGAISYEIDGEGFWFPRIDGERCIQCGLCDQACPALACHRSGSEGGAEPKVYKTYHRDREIRINSTSGALFTALADAILRKGGYIAGCAFSDDYSTARHEIVHTPEGVRRLSRSKYFQSDTEGIYRQVRQLLNEGETVLFCGLPCQISALYGFLRKDYEKLYTAELICLGINSPLAYTKFLEELKETYRSEIAEVHFKNKSRAWVNLTTRVTLKNGEVYSRGVEDDAWVNGFINGKLYIRRSCANCRYKEFPRMSDITMGDFWGLKFTEEEKKLGVSVALVNTMRGEELLDAAGSDLVIEERGLEEAKAGNPALISSVALDYDAREKFFRRIQKEPYSKVVWDIINSRRRVKPYRRLVRAVKRRIKRIFK